MIRNLLILGGTQEAGDLAAAASALALHITVSLAGRTADARNASLQQARYPGAGIRIGGFGGFAGLQRYLEEAAIDAVIDATHPFATQISAHAAAACRASDVPLLRFERPCWQPAPGDRWSEVASFEQAATLLPNLGRRVWLTTGQSSLKAFAHLDECWFLVRLIDGTSRGLPFKQGLLITGKGPFEPAAERALIIDHGIEVLITKASGGEAGVAKLIAARQAGIPVILLRRPDPPVKHFASQIEEAMIWLQARLKPLNSQENR